MDHANKGLSPTSFKLCRPGRLSNLQVTWTWKCVLDKDHAGPTRRRTVHFLSPSGYELSSLVLICINIPFKFTTVLCTSRKVITGTYSIKFWSVALTKQQYLTSLEWERVGTAALSPLNKGMKELWKDMKYAYCWPSMVVPHMPKDVLPHGTLTAQTCFSSFSNFNIAGMEFQILFVNLTSISFEV